MASDSPGARLGRRLRVLREERFMSQEALAQAAGLSQRTLRKIEGGATRLPQHKTLEKLAGALGITVDELIGTPRPVNPPLELTLSYMFRQAPPERRALLGAATDSEISRYQQSIDVVLDRIAGYDEQDQEGLAEYVEVLRDLRAETDPFDVVPPSKEQRAALAVHASVVPV
jgi:transcriptional regulator with XRE-family HTH domain